MSALDSINEVVCVIKTAGLKKEYAQRIEMQLSSVAGQIKTVESECVRLKAENEKLKMQITGLQPQGEEISHDTSKILKHFFERAQDISADEISAVFKWKQSVVDYHIDVLLNKRFIRESTNGMQTSSGAKFGLTTLGRRYVVEYINK
jgi:hypothetical protein